MAPELLHIVGYLTGATLYAMLLVMALRGAPGDRLTVCAAGLGLTWNVGELMGHGVHALGWLRAEPWVAAASFTALGFLATVVIHSVARGTRDDAGPPTWLRALTAVAYGSAGLAGLRQFVAAGRGDAVPESTALLLLTFALVALVPLLFAMTRRQPQSRRAMWMTALAVFAISALHVTNFHGPREAWATELLGHHSSIPLAFAFLYQDYRFALADLFLKQALTVVLMVAVVFGSWSAAGPGFARAPDSPEATALLLGLWVLSTFAFPVIRRAVNVFVDRVVLARADGHMMLERVMTEVQNATSERDLLDHACRAVAPALSAAAVTWEARETPAARRGAAAVGLVTNEAPHYTLNVGQLAGGRRLLSGDLEMLDRVASALGRRIDALRLTQERYDRVLREQEMQALATDAELRALRAQINPHFLFNALTTIGHLIQEAPARAVSTLVTLTTLLRSVMRTDGAFTTLRREVELIECYLAIERARFEDRLQVAITVPEAVADLQIPALLVQPLVENAVKHGVAGSRAGGRVTVAASLEGPHRLCVSVRNTGAPLRGRLDAAPGGVGLRNVERRLASYYGDAGTLVLTVTPDGDTLAEIRLPVGEGAGSANASGRGLARA